MTVRYVCGAIAAGLLTCGAPTLASAQTIKEVILINAAVLPEQGGTITLAGCFQRGGKHNKFVLSNPMMGPVTGIPEAKATCPAKGNPPMVKLNDTKELKLRQAVVGQLIEVTGRLETAEKSDDWDDLREVHVRSYRFVPIIPPHVAEAAPAPEPARPTYEPAPQTAEVVVLEEKPVATSGQIETLPKTASPLPLAGFVGFLSLAAGLALRRFRRQQAHQGA